MTFAIPNSVARLLLLDHELGKQTVCQLQAAWPWTSWVTLLLAAAAIAIVLAIYRRDAARATQPVRLLLVALRLSIVGLVLLMIGQITLIVSHRGQAEVLLVVDNSRSMSATDTPIATSATKPGTRFDRLQTFLTVNDAAILRRIAAAHRLELATLDGSLVAPNASITDSVKALLVAKSDAKTTRLGNAVLSALGDSSNSVPVAIVLLTDGICNDGPTLAEAAEAARQRGVPLYFVGFGNHRPTERLRISDLLVDRAVYVNDAVQFECRLTSDGPVGERIQIELREKNKPDVLARTEAIVARSGQSQPIRLQYAPKQPGRLEYNLQAHAGRGGPARHSNVLSGHLDIRDEKIRVLLAQSSPSFEYRYLRMLLLREKAFILDTVLQEADPEISRQDPTLRTSFPSQRNELFAYDVIIFGDVNPALLGPTTAQDLVDYVRQPGRGGALVMIAGQRYLPQMYGNTPLAQLLPFTGERLSPNATQAAVLPPFVVRPTAMGLAWPGMQLAATEAENAKVWAGMAPLDWLVELPTLKPGVRVLADDPTQSGKNGQPLPVFCFQYFGSGRVLFHATDETWRWRFRVGDEFFGRYWLQTLRYLGRSKLDNSGPIRLSVDRREYRPSEMVQLQAHFLDEQLAPNRDQEVIAVVNGPNGLSERCRLTPRGSDRSVFIGQSSATVPGEYRAWLAQPPTTGMPPAVEFSVASSNDEMDNLQMNESEMIRAAERTGGRFYTVDGAGRLAGDLPTGDTTQIEAMPPLPLWNRWPMLALLVVLLGAEWTVRRRQGLA